MLILGKKDREPRRPFEARREVWLKSKGWTPGCCTHAHCDVGA